MNTLAAFVRASREAIVASWLARVEQLPSARDQSYAGLRDHVPELLEHLADALERGEPLTGKLDHVAGQHAALRYHAGYNLRQVVLEYQVLRQCILELCDRAGGELPSMRAFTALDRAIDEAIGDAIDRYTDERDRTRDTFVGILGHDLRNPLGSIDNGAQVLLLRDDLDEPARRVVTTMARAARRMDALILDVLDFARARLGSGIPIRPAWIDVRPVVRAVVDELVAGNPARSIECAASEVTADLEGEWDGSRIAQALSNLVANAIEHGSDPIVVEAIDLDDRVRIEVRDRGVIPADIRPTLFQPFHRGRGGRGLGLGLYVVDEITRAHGGWVDVHSDPTDGTTFALVLPRRVGELTDAPPR